jgi:hypothetical protein
MKELPLLTRQVLAIEATVPTVYVYPSVEALRAHSCVAAGAVAYYDGSIHVAVLDQDVERSELRKSLRHEYTHHVLVSHGIEGPTWFHEGEAMVVSREWPVGYRFEGRPIDIETMVAAFPHTADPQFARDYYGQAYTMVTFLARLRTSRGDLITDSASELVQGLSAGSTTPEGLFEWTIDTRLPGLRDRPLAVWEDYVARDKSLSPGVQDLILAKGTRRDSGR